MSLLDDESDHAGCVDAWMERETAGLPPDRLLGAFERAFAAMWARAHRTLGDVTLTAIVDRVLYVAAEKHPAFSSLTVAGTGLRCEELHRRAGSLRGDQLADGVRFVLVELLTVLGNLTDEILSPALHDALSSVTGEERDRSAGELTAPQRAGSEEAKS